MKPEHKLCAECKGKMSDKDIGGYNDDFSQAFGDICSWTLTYDGMPDYVRGDRGRNHYPTAKDKERGAA